MSLRKTEFQVKDLKWLYALVGMFWNNYGLVKLSCQSYFRLCLAGLCMFESAVQDHGSERFTPHHYTFCV